MDLGVFCPVVNNHNVASKNLKTFDPTWELNRDFVKLAEDAGFKFALSQVTLAGWGGATQHWDKSLESFTLMSALAAVTSKIRLYASVAVLTIPPPIVARMAVTIDDISDGRFGVNIVSGYNKKQYAQMGLWPGDEFFQTRYDYSSEYVQILKELWTNGESDFKGKYLEMSNCKLGPLPANEIEIVCAGASGRGLDFTARYGDYSFLMPAGGAEGVRQANDDLLEAARRHGREGAGQDRALQGGRRHGGAGERAGRRARRRLRHHRPAHRHAARVGVLRPQPHRRLAGDGRAAAAGDRRGRGHRRRDAHLRRADARPHALLRRRAATPEGRRGRHLIAGH
jgi:alkanesulfonate monooxygenase SsuD/methylene tetrahydromethanopterin reductase-like flavin-dependent oxidoreductase (luciferase family)